MQADSWLKRMFMAALSRQFSVLKDQDHICFRNWLHPKQVLLVSSAAIAFHVSVSAMLMSPACPLHLTFTEMESNLSL